MDPKDQEEFLNKINRFFDLRLEDRFNEWCDLEKQKLTTKYLSRLEFSSKDLDYHKTKLYIVDPKDDYWQVKKYLEFIELEAGLDQSRYLRQRILASELNAFKKLDRWIPKHICQLEAIKDAQLSLYEIERENNIRPEFPKIHYKLIAELENSIEFYKTNFYIREKILLKIEQYYVLIEL